MTIAPVDTTQADRPSGISDMRHRNIPSPRRVATEPATVQRDRLATSSPSTVVKTLYSHPDAKIVSFTSSGHPHPHTTGNSSHPLEGEVSGELPWWSPLERTIAVGAFCVYRAPGSVAFLSCGSALQPILPKSQCWCVDQEDSKFVLQIRRPYYWRIELPVSNMEEADKARQFKDTLERVLLFEKTKCPFQRAFTVELPEAPQVKQKPWTPVTSQNIICSNISKPKSVQNHETTALIGSEHRNDHATPLNQHLATCSTSAACAAIKLVEKSCTTASKMFEAEKKDTGRWPGMGTSDSMIVPVNDSAVGLERQAKHQTEGQRRSRHFVGSDFPHSHRESQCVVHSTPRDIRPFTHHLQQDLDGPLTPITAEPNVPSWGDANSSIILSDVHEGTGSHEDLQQPKLRYFLGNRGCRSFTSPHQLTAPHPLTSIKSPSAPQDTEAVDLSGEESLGSFYSASSSLDSDVLSIPASYVPAQEYPIIPSAQDYHCESLDATGRRGSCSDAEGEVDRFVASHDTGTQHSARASALDMQVDRTRMRLLRKQPRVPLDAATILEPSVEHGESHGDFKPPDAGHGRLGTLRNLPLAIVTKTYNILMGPPSHLVALMLRIAARICAGEWRGEDISFAVTGQVIPVRWDYSSGEHGGWCKKDIPDGGTEECHPWHDNNEIQAYAIRESCCTSLSTQS